MFTKLVPLINFINTYVKENLPVWRFDGYNHDANAVLKILEEDRLHMGMSLVEYSLKYRDDATETAESLCHKIGKLEKQLDDEESDEDSEEEEVDKTSWGRKRRR